MWFDTTPLQAQNEKICQKFGERPWLPWLRLSAEPSWLIPRKLGAI